MSENNGYTENDGYTNNSEYTDTDSSHSSGSGSTYNTTGNSGSTYNTTGNSYSYGGYYESSGSSSGSQGSGASDSSSGAGGSGFHNGSGSGKKPGEKKPKKRGGIFHRAVAIAMSAVLFGGVAGSVMVGVQYAAQKTGIVAESNQETQGQTPVKIAESTNASSSNSSDSSQTDVSDVVDKVLPSVVSITNSQLYENYAQQYGRYFWFGNYGSGSQNGQQEEIEAGSGSGIIIGQNDSELLIVTNYHVIEDADSLTITFTDEATAKASVKGTDSDNDLAVVAVPLSDLKDETKNAIAIATLDSSDNCKVGQRVIAIGNALGYGQSVTVGYISALNRAVKTSDGASTNLLQTDAAINPGNSGGALVNSNGDIIGINSAKYSDTDVEGMGFAIPISAVHDIIDDLMNQETKMEVAEDQRGYLGINCSSVDSSYSQMYNMPEGVYVSTILDGGAASKSELQERDIITKINGATVNTAAELTEQLKYYAIGDKVTLTVSRLNGTEYESMQIEVTLAKQVK